MADFAQTLQIVRDLVDRFRANPPENEASVRVAFVNPFFEALGWDVANRAGHAEEYKDVLLEDRLPVGTATKAPDYCFRIGGVRKFFVEAKNPSEDVKGDPHHAYQLRRYAWSAKLPLSILTDFEEFAVYDCTTRPAETDKASKARILYLTCDQYGEKLHEIWDIFAKDSVLKGSFDRYGEKARGTAQVDAEFLKEIEAWRDSLARSIALRNPKLDIDQLNQAVQRVIDRIIFLRMAEDRGIESQGRLLALVNADHIYKRFGTLCEHADAKYNSGLFDFTADNWTLALQVDDKVLKPIIEGIYYPKSPYEFSVIPPEILGNVYEQFLGKVIRLTPAHQAKVEEKPEVKKAGGVYYTPKYIVDYIVKNTVGKLIEGKSPAQLRQFHVLDPACGSGSFLLGAYQCLLDHYLKWYLAHGAEKHNRAVYGKSPTELRLTTPERKRILLAHVCGVDIDPQAVEVTKLSLLLKVLEGESADSLGRQFHLFHERALPNLDQNIKCGNSLIGPDYLEGRLKGTIDPDELRRVNPFDWQHEFPHILGTKVPKNKRGFDAVIGNPPYVRQESLSDQKDYLQSRYESFDGVADLYAYFMEKGVRLLRDDGLFSIVVSSSFLRATYGEPLRRFLKNAASIIRIVDFGGRSVFENAKDTYVCVPLLSKRGKQERVQVCRVQSLGVQDLNAYVTENHYTIPHERLSTEAWSLKSDNEAAVFAKVMNAGKPLGEYVERRFFRGVTTGLNHAFIIDTQTRRRLLAKDKRNAELIHPLLGGEDVRRYIFHETGLWLIFTRRGVDIRKYPAIRDHLEQWKEDLTPKRDKKAECGRKPGRYRWYEIQDDVAYYQVFDGPKLVFPDIAKGPRFCLDTGGHYLTNTAYCLGTDDLYLLGILNSRLFWFAISHISIPFGIRAGEYRYRLIYQYMEKVPIRAADLSVPTDRTRHDRVVALVERMLDLHKQIHAAKTDRDRELFQRQIDATDRRIDELVYNLYGLTEKEIKIVEGATHV